MDLSEGRLRCHVSRVLIPWLLGDAMTGIIFRREKS
jgi:hypothetical protein